MWLPRRCGSLAGTRGAARLRLARGCEPVDTGGVGGAALVTGFLLGRARRRGAPPAEVGHGEARRQEDADLRARAQQRELAKVGAQKQELVALLINLPEVINKIGAARSTAELGRTTARALMDLVGAKRIGIFLFDEATRVFTLAVYAGGDRANLGATFAPGEGRLGALAELVGVRTADDVEPKPGAPAAADRLFRPDLCVAMRRHDTTYAFAVIDEPAHNDQMLRRVMQMIADVYAVSAEGVRAFDHVRLEADTDRLTGLYNRRHLDRRLADEVARARSYGMALSVFLFDIDNFKHFNDTHGHQAGDDCLRDVANLAARVTRSSDIVCRYGGEEFLVILLGADGHAAALHAERIRRTIATAPLAHAAEQPLGCVSISGGVASFPDDGQDPATLVKLADDALYRAKEGGRNRVVRAQP
jgi:diguanylate cyclase (GGDEF)-like protein